jgi:hypothetical protein
MIYELINNDHHKNNCALFKCFDDKDIFYKKLSFSAHGNSVIENENNGYCWYYSAIKEKNSIILIETDFYEINIPHFQGLQFPFNYKYPGNTKTIKTLILFYIKYFSGKEMIAIHGDFALSNIVLGLGNNIYIFDWEHFHLATSDYYGFDIIHLLFLTLYQRVDKISSSEQLFLKQCYNMLRDSSTRNNKIMEKPFVNSQEYMIKYAVKFNLNIPINHKFIFAEFPKNILEKIDMMLT